jgi:hypothetical protein
MFSPWSFNIDKASERLLASAGWNKPDPDTYPTGRELLPQYLEPLATRTALADHIQTPVGSECAQSACVTRQ